MKLNFSFLKVLAVAASTSLLMPGVSLGQSTLGPDGNYYQCFTFSGSDMTWAGAYAEAQTQTFDNNGTIVYGRLAPVATQEMAGFVNTLVENTWGDWAIAWIGDYANNGVLYAGSSGAVGDTSWVAWDTPDLASTVGQPGNYGITTSGGGYGYIWAARPASENDIGGYIVQFDLTPIPEPSTLALAGLGGLVLLFYRRRQ